MHTNRCPIKVLVVAHGNADQKTAYKHRTLIMAEALIEAGYHVSLLWFYPANRIGKKKFFAKVSDKDTGANLLSVIFCPALPLYRFRALKNVSRRWCSFFLRLLCWVKEFAIVHAEDSVCGGFLKSVSARSLLVVDMHGDYAAELEMKNAPAWQVFLAKNDQKLAASHASAIVYVSDPLKDAVQKNHSAATFSLVLPCAVNLEKFFLSSSARNEIRLALNLQGRKVFCYCGGISAWQCVWEMLDLVERLRTLDPEVFFLFISHGDITPYLDRFQRIGRAGVDYHTLTVDHDEVCKYLNASDFGLLLRTDIIVNRVAAPTKLGEYLACGLPVITTRFAGNASGIVSTSGCGIVLDNAVVSDYDVANLIEFTTSTMQQRSEIAMRCKGTAEAFLSLDAGKGDLWSLYDKLLDSVV